MPRSRCQHDRVRFSTRSAAVIAAASLGTKRDVRAVDELALGFNVVVQLGRQGQQVNIFALGQPVVNAQAGRARTAVDENGRFFVISSLTSG